MPRSICQVLSRLWTVAMLLVGGTAAAQVFPHSAIQKTGARYQITVGALPDHYFHFQHSTDLRQFSTIDAALGAPAATFDYLPAVGEMRGFFRAEAISVWSPSDVDQDGMDDLWELLNGLAPVDPADAGEPSPLQPGLTNLEAYRLRFGLTRVTEFYSVETSVFNNTFAISDEVSVYRFPHTTGFTVEALSAETSVFNFPPVTGASVAAVSAEVSLFNTAPVTGPAVQAISPEVSVFNSFALTPTLQAVSPEVSVFNSFVVTPALQAVSPEVSVLKSLP